MLCDTDAETALRLLKNTKNTQKFPERRIPHSGRSCLWILSVLSQKKIKILDNKRVNRRIKYQSRLSIYFPMFLQQMHQIFSISRWNESSDICPVCKRTNCLDKSIFYRYCPNHLRVNYKITYRNHKKLLNH